MEVVFRTKRLRLHYEESDRAVRRWGPEVARIFIRRIETLYTIKDFREAYNLQSMRLHPLKGGRKGELSIHLTARWRLVVIEGDTDECVIIKEVTNHYDD